MTLAADAWTLAFGALTVEEGLRLREAAEARHFPASDPERFRKLIGVADLDAFLTTDAARSPRVGMADSRRPDSPGLPDELFTHADGLVDLPRLFEQFDGGATLVASQFHEMHPPLGRFCRGLERVFLHAVQANVYLTPPNAQGFRAHYDTHDVLVLQVRGLKRWRLWTHQPVRHPTVRTPWSGADKQLPDEEPRVLVMRPGDVLYVPRGVLHDAATEDETDVSLHVTVGLLEPAWADALRAALDVMEVQDPALREAFPTWRLAEPGAMPALVETLAQRLSSLGGRTVLDLVAQRLLGALATGNMPMLSRGLLAPQPGPRSRLRLSDSVHHHLVANGHGGELHWAGGREVLSAEQIGWLQRLDRGATPEELGDGPETLEFCRRLTALGLLTPLPSASAH
jgi:hypothetical protein